MPKQKSVTLNVFHLPVLLILLVVAGVSAGTISLNKYLSKDKAAPSAVLSEDDDREDSEDSDDEEDDEDENDDEESSNESAKKAEEQRREAAKKAVESQRESAKKAAERVRESSKNTIRLSTGATTATKIEDADDELDDSEEKAEVSSVTNDDGTVTKTYKKIDGDEIETKIITYDALGNVISKQELNEDGSEDTEKTSVVSSVVNADGTITKIFSKTEGTKVEMRSLTYNAAGQLIKKAELNPDGTVREEELINGDDDSEDRESTESEDDDQEFELTFVPTSGGSIDPALSTIIKAKLKQEIENEEGLGASVNKVKLSIKTDQGTLKYEGVASKEEKLFGLFGIEIPVDIEIDPITGKILTVNQSFWTKIVEFLSF